MAKADDFDARIAAYFGGGMDSEQETAFMQELDANPTLRQKFEDELRVGAILQGVPVEKLQVNDKPIKSGGTRIVSLTTLTWLAAAAAVLALAVSLFYLVNHKNGITGQGNTTTANAIKSATNPIDTALHVKNAYTKYYTIYIGDNDPVELGYYYNQYKKGNYDIVLSATPADLQQMGTNDNTNLLNQYLQLYQGLAYLAQNNAQSAVDKFDTILHKADSTTPQYYSAQWYSCLAYLKLKQANKCDSVAVVITNGTSPFKAQAQGLRQALAGR